MQRVDKSPESPKTAEKLEYFADHDLRNIENVTPSMLLLNIPLLYQKVNSGGHSNNICTDDRFLQEKSFFEERTG